MSYVIKQRFNLCCYMHIACNKYIIEKIKGKVWDMHSIWKYITIIFLLVCQNAMAEWYVGTDVIEDRAIPNFYNLPENNLQNRNDTAADGVALFGGYRPSQFFSVQVEYHDELAFGIDDIFAGSSLWFPDAEPSNFDSNALFLSGISSYDLNESTSFYMKGGVFNWEVDNRSLESSENYLGRNQGMDIFFGLGANYDLNTRFEVSAEWERYHMEESEVDYLSTELKFKF